MHKKYSYFPFENIDSFSGDLNEYIESINDHVDEYMEMLKSELSSTAMYKMRNMDWQKAVYISLLAKKYALEFNLMFLHLNPKDAQAMADGVRIKSHDRLIITETELLSKTADNLEALTSPIMRDARVTRMTRDLARRRRNEAKKQINYNLAKTVAKEVNF